MAGGSGRQSNDVRLGDALLGLPCLQRQRANLAGCARERGGTPHREVCPVCGIEADELVSGAGFVDREVSGRLQDRFPGWQPEDGLCRPCLELFKEAGS